MKRPIHTYVLNPTAGTLDLSGITGFDVRNLYAVIDLDAGRTIYAPTASLGYAGISGGVLTLKVAINDLSASDQLLVLYDDGGRPAEDASVQQVVDRLAGLLTLGQGGAALSPTNRLPVEIDADNVVLSLPAGLAQDVTIAAGNAELAAILAKIAGDPSTGTGQASQLSELGLILAKMTSDPSTGSAQASMLAKLSAILAALQSQLDLAALYVTDGARPTPHFYVRRETIPAGGGAPVVVIENMDGSTPSPMPDITTLVPLSGSSSVAIVADFFDATGGGTGYAAQDALARVLFINTTTQAVVGWSWQNISQGTTIAAPGAGTYVEQPKVLPTGAAVAALQPALHADGGSLAHVTNFPAVQPISGGVSILGPVAVTGTFYQPTQPVSGQFWQATQPVSVTALPLPFGAAQDGSDATGVAAPVGAAGIRGWLSGIYKQGLDTTPVATTVADGGNATMGTTTDAAYAGFGSSTLVALLRGIYLQGTSTTPVATTAADGSSVTIGSSTDTATANTLMGVTRAVLAKLGSVVLGAGTAIIGRVGIDQTSPGTTNGVVVNNTALAMTAADGAQVAIGSRADAAATSTSTSGSVIAYLRGLLAAAVLPTQDVRTTGQTLVTTAVNAAYAIAVNGEGTVGFNVMGLSASGATLIIEYANDGGTNWSATSAIIGGVLTSTVVADGSFRVNAGGHTNLRLRVSVAGSSPVTIANNISAVPSTVIVTGPVTLAATATPSSVVGAVQQGPGSQNGAIANVALNGTTISQIVAARAARAQVLLAKSGSGPVTLSFDASQANQFPWVGAAGSYFPIPAGVAVWASLASGDTQTVSAMEIF